MNEIIIEVWLFVWLPMWLILIPVNYFLSKAVLRYCQKNLDIGNKDLVKSYLRKVWAFGSWNNFTGLCLLSLVFPYIDTFNNAWSNSVVNAVITNCFTNIYAFLIIAAIILYAGANIYYFDNLILKKDLDKQPAKYIALRIAVITAPYLFLLPAGLIFKG